MDGHSITSIVSHRTEVTVRDDGAEIADVRRVPEMTGSNGINDAQLIQSYEQWVDSKAMACVFARWYVRHSDAPAERSVRVVRGTSAVDTALRIEKAVFEAVDDLNCSSCVVIVPTILTVESLLAVVAQLPKSAGWKYNSNRVNWASNAYDVFELTREIPTSRGPSPSEVLVSGPFADFPATRNFECVALELYVGEPSQTDPVSGKPTNRANLAHLPTATTRGTKPFASTLYKTRKFRHEMLGERVPAPGDPPLPNEERDPRVRARVSFSVLKTSNT